MSEKEATKVCIHSEDHTHMYSQLYKAVSLGMAAYKAGYIGSSRKQFV